MCVRVCVCQCVCVSEAVVKLLEELDVPSLCVLVVWYYVPLPTGVA